MATADRFDADAILSHLRTRSIGRPLEWFPALESTSATAMERAQGGAPHGLVVVADGQSLGRGRRGRSWISPPGLNLYLSVVLRPALPPTRAPELTLVAALACCEALREVGCDAHIKWPNDVLIGDRKAAGILSEMVASPELLRFVVLGIGVDVNMAESDFPEELRPVATSVRLALGAPVPRAPLCASLLGGLEHWLDRHQREGFGAVRRRWSELSSTLGARVRVSLVERELEGVAEGLEEDGALRVRTDAGAVERVVAGDVQYLRAQKAPSGSSRAP